MCSLSVHLHWSHRRSQLSSWNWTAEHTGDIKCWKKLYRDAFLLEGLPSPRWEGCLVCASQRRAILVLLYPRWQWINCIVKLFGGLIKPLINSWQSLCIPHAHLLMHIPLCAQLTLVWISILYVLASFFIWKWLLLVFYQCIKYKLWKEFLWGSWILDQYVLSCNLLQDVYWSLLLDIGVCQHRSDLSDECCCNHVCAW